jgi:superfamily II DNA or RNA helicase
VSSLPELRPYQREAIDAVVAARRSGTKRMVVCLPTGAGKTVIFSRLARLARRQVLVLAHREELLGQAKDKLERALDGTSVVALERGGERAANDAKVVVASLRSLHEQRLARVLQGRDLGLVIYDECHHAAADDNLRILRQLGAFERDWEGTLLGFTATTARGDGKGLDQVFERIVYSKTLPDLVDAGYLARLKGFRINTAADLSRITSGGADFPEDELAEAVDIEERKPWWPARFRSWRATGAPSRFVSPSTTRGTCRTRSTPSACPQASSTGPWRQLIARRRSPTFALGAFR